MSKESQSYVVAGAVLKCSKAENGQKCYLNLPVSHGVETSDGGAQCNIEDNKVPENISTFGMCTDGKKCVPEFRHTWLDGKQDTLIDGAPALIDGCHMQCAREGIVTIKEDGQEKHFWKDIQDSLPNLDYVGWGMDRMIDRKVSELSRSLHIAASSIYHMDEFVEKSYVKWVNTLEKVKKYGGKALIVTAVGVDYLGLREAGDSRENAGVKAAAHLSIDLVSGAIVEVTCVQATAVTVGAGSAVVGGIAGLGAFGVGAIPGAATGFVAGYAVGASEAFVPCTLVSATYSPSISDPIKKKFDYAYDNLDTIPRKILLGQWSDIWQEGE